MFRLPLWVLCGVLTGWISYLAMRTTESRGLLAYMTGAVIGAILGGYATRNIDNGGIFAVDGPSLLSAILGAVLGVLVIARLDSMGDA